MEDYKAFIKEVSSLEVRAVKLLTESVGAYPLRLLNPDEFSQEDLIAIHKNKSGMILEYWDLSHYSASNEKEFGDSYKNKMKAMAKMAFIDLQSNKSLMENITKALGQFIEPFTRFAVNYYKEHMNQYAVTLFSDFELNTRYSQCDLRLKYLSCFDVTGIEKDYNGYSPDFIQQLYEIYLIKRGALELFRSNLIGATAGILKRKKPISREIDEFVFDELSFCWVQNEKKNIDPLCFINDDVIDSFLNAEKKAMGESGKFQSEIRCAAFCEMLYNKRHIRNTNTRQKTMNDFAKIRYGIIIKSALLSSKKKDRENHQTKKVNGLIPLRDCF